MEEKILAYYDIMEIQKYIYSSNRLRENIGASIIVQDIFNSIVDESFRKICPVYWSDDKIMPNMDHTQYNCLKIFHGGGNALFIFDTMQRAISSTQELSKKILEITGGTLFFTVAYHKTNFENFWKDYQELLKQIRIKKNQYLFTNPLMGIGITKNELQNGLPVTRMDEDTFISNPTWQKLEYEKKHRNYFSEYIEEKSQKKYQFPRDLDSLGQKKGQFDFISIVHIDGNSTGQILQENLENEIDFSQAIWKLHNLSHKLDMIYFETLKQTISILINSFSNPKFMDNISLTRCEEKDYEYLPIRPIVRNGDDITFISNGKLGLSLAEEFLKILSQKTLNLDNKSISLTACAGVAITKSSFPFFRGYEFAEQLCQSAKKKNTIISEQLNDDHIHMKSGNWIDFQILQNNTCEDLNGIRQNLYNIPDMSPPEQLKNRDRGIKHEQFNLLWRPWCIDGSSNGKYLWSNCVKISEFPSWVTSKLEELERSFFIDNTSISKFIQQMNARNLSLPIIDNSTEIFRENITPYLDALEVKKFYISLMKGE